jgi:nicotinamide-nucleotide amidase
MTSPVIAEIIAIGDELTSGFRLDTNSQWLAQQLGDLGIVVLYHSTVGDDIGANVDVFKHAFTRADIVVTTGGLGPTADDLTRQALADAAGVELRMHEDQLEHLKTFFTRRGRTMTPSNEIQAYFPAGAVVVPNPEGTAPGIELTHRGSQRETIVFCLPGVPAEMKQMYAQTLQPRLQEITGQTQTIHHHVVRCFGSGESHIESLLPDLVKRGRDPQVGITASHGTISLRLTTKGDSIEDCLKKMAPTLETIHECLGQLVFGFNDETLESLVAARYDAAGKTIAITDAGMLGAPAVLLKKSKTPLNAAEIVDFEAGEVPQRAVEILQRAKADVGVAIGPIQRDEVVVAAGQSNYVVAIATKGSDAVQTHEFMFSGHSAIRETLANKRVLNVLRLL